MNTTSPSQPARTQIFQFGDTPVHSIRRDGDVWFVLSDVAQAMGYTDAAQVTRWLDDDEYQVIKASDIPGHGTPAPSAGAAPGTDTPTPLAAHRRITLVTEPGLYHLMSRSRRPEAAAFRRWIRHDVLPAIRRTGRYDLADESSHTPELAEAQRAVREMSTEVLHLREVNTELDSQAVAAIGAEHHSGGQALYDLRETLASELGVPVRQVMSRLVELGVLVRRDHGGFWIKGSWRDVLFCTRSLPGACEVVVEPADWGTPRVQPGCQRELLRRLVDAEARLISV